MDDKDIFPCYLGVADKHCEGQRVTYGAFLQRMLPCGSLTFCTDELHWCHTLRCILGCLKVAAEAQFSCPQFGPHAQRPISYLGTLLAFEVHVTPDSSILAIMI